MTFRIAVTPGEPAGIGPDICIQLAQTPPVDTEMVVIADPDLLQQRALMLNLPLELVPFDPQSPASPGKPGCLSVLPVTLGEPCIANQLTTANVPYVLETLKLALKHCLRNDFDAMVTGPVHKGIINESGTAFSGHTEYLAEQCGVPLTVMMLATPGLRVALTTIHIPLRAVADTITPELLGNIIDILEAELRFRFNIMQPHILVCGLNPHAGEGGYLGDEEIKVIIPVLNRKRQEGMSITGPLPADTLFTDKHLASADVVLAMYHDQGLPVLKYMGFGNACNITLGLPVIRTSVDHGTALDLAGSGRTNFGSLGNAIATACLMASNSRLRDAEDLS
ncbi:MAG: 4-hydroxythreonine-4-phosphate dehydrogenase PdxA [Pseudomonadales bacterium]|nr:4-hydroxythreonine-4-phosphate dehydrogenase PdxA [Pseudomonadales bacterium]